MEALDLEKAKSQLDIELRIKEGAENLLSAFEAGSVQRNASFDDPEFRSQVELELESANERVAALEERIQELTQAHTLQPLLDPNLLRRPESPFHSPLVTPSDVGDFVFSPHNPENDVYLPSLQEVMDMLLSLKTAGSAAISTMYSLTQVFKLDPVMLHDMPMHTIISCILPNLSDRTNSDTRASAYRFIRYLCQDHRAVGEIFDNHLDIYLIRSLAGHSKNEKVQALLLIRHLMMPIPYIERIPLTPGIIRAIVSIAETKDDEFKPICLETLVELLVLDVELLVESDSIDVIFEALAEELVLGRRTAVDEPQSFAMEEMDEQPIVLAVIITELLPYFLDFPQYRYHIRTGQHLEVALTNFTAADPNPDISQRRKKKLKSKLKSSVGVFSNLVKSWSGFMYLCLNKKESIRSLISALSISSDMVQETLIDCFSGIFDITIPECVNSSILKPNASSTSSFSGHDRTHLIDQYHGLLLLVFLDCELLERLVDIAEHNTKLSEKASVLVAKILRMTSRILPLEYGAKIQSLPQLFSLTSGFKEQEGRFLGLTVLHVVDSLRREWVLSDVRKSIEARNARGRERTTSLTGSITINDRLRTNSFDDPVFSRGQMQIESSKLRLAMQIDDHSFRNKLIESGVLSSKDTSRWNFDIIVELFEGPLMNAKRLEEATRGSKFIRRVVRFFYPIERSYSDMRKTKNNEKYTALGCKMLSTLLTNHEGIRFLGDNKFLHQVAEILVDLDPLGASQSKNTFLSKHRMENTLSSGYFEMLGTLSTYSHGVALMERFKIFTILYRLTEVKSREDISAAIVNNLRYEIDGHARIILSKALMSSYKHVRLLATNKVARLLGEWEGGDREWLMELMVTQLYDPSPEVQELAVKVVDEACESIDDLEAVVKMRPSLNHLADVGAPLLFRFLSAPIGVRYLDEIKYIDREMEDWFDYRNDVYTLQLEMHLSKAFGNDSDRAEVLAASGFDGRVPPHFYGELIKTSEGREILRNKGHFAEFARIIRTYGLEDKDVETISKVKSALWAVGNVAATESGVMFLEEEELIKTIVDLAQSSLCFSVRGTCYFVAGLISSTAAGADILDELGWVSVCTSVGIPRGLCVPADLDSVVCVNRSQSMVMNGTSSREDGGSEEEAQGRNEEEEEEEEDNESDVLIGAMACFSYSFTKLGGESEYATLARAKAVDRKGRIFGTPRMQWWAMHLLATRRYTLEKRQYLLGLFAEWPLDEARTAAVAAAGKGEDKTTAERFVQRRIARRSRNLKGSGARA